MVSDKRKYATFKFNDEQMADLKAHVEHEAMKRGAMTHREILADEHAHLRTRANDPDVIEDVFFALHPFITVDDGIILQSTRGIINAVLDTVRELNRIGVRVESRVEERDDGVEVIVRIPKSSTNE